MTPEQAARKQVAIEEEAGIDEAVAAHINKHGTPAAKRAMSMLRMAIASKDHPTMALLRAAVDQCKGELTR